MTAAKQSLTDALMNAPVIMTPTRARHILRTLADPANRDALMAWLVEEGIASEAGAWEGTCWDDPSLTSIYDEHEAHPADAVPLWRFNREGKRV